MRSAKIWEGAVVVIALSFLQILGKGQNGKRINRQAQVGLPLFNIMFLTRKALRATVQS
jgi:hypothetical protein